MKISAKAVSYTDDGYCTTLSFADDVNNPSNFVMLSMTNNPDEQDVELGQEGVHIDVGGLQIDGYDLITDLRATAYGLIVSLTPAAFQKAIAQDIEIELESLIVDGIPVNEVVAKFRSRLANE